MKRWGLVITLFYGLVVAALSLPGGLLLVEKRPSLIFGNIDLMEVLNRYGEFYGHWFPLIWLVILVTGQALLLFLSVDTSWRRTKPRQHAAVTAVLTAFFAAVLTSAAWLSLGVAVYGDNPPSLWQGKAELFGWTVIGTWIGLWVIWGGIFYEYYRDASNAVSRIVTWLLRGSVLELLVAVPSHVIVRNRGDCSAPVVTSFGIVTGAAIMLLCFGPGVLALYKKRFDAYRHKPAQSA